MNIRTSARRSTILIGERKTTVFQRISAKGIDLMLLAALYFLGNVLFPYLGLFAACLLSSFQDATGVGQSVGKKIIGLRVMDDVTGSSCSFENSFFRNLPLTLFIFLSAFPICWGFALILVVPVLILEFYFISTIDTGVRLGDIMGNTLVVEYFEEQWDGE